jgi:hypothetical protein
MRAPGFIRLVAFLGAFGRRAAAAAVIALCIDDSGMTSGSRTGVLLTIRGRLSLDCLAPGNRLRFIAANKQSEEQSRRRVTGFRLFNLDQFAQT